MKKFNRKWRVASSEWRVALLVLLITLHSPLSTAFANNVTVSDTQLLEPNDTTGTVKVTFRLTQANSFDTTYDSLSFGDYIWVFVKYSKLPVSETVGYKHASLISGTGCVTPTSDSAGVFIKASADTTISLLWKFIDNSVAVYETAQVKVCAMEMVKIPTGSFYYDAGGIGGTAYNNYGGTAQILVSDSTTCRPTGASPGWPNGYSSFYIAKYEVSQGQYADFLNMLDTAAAAVYRNDTAIVGTAWAHTISYTAGNPYGSRYAAGSPARCSAYLSWDDVEAYCSWAALRPMTEMEFEKAARGTSGGVCSTAVYPWNSTDPSTGNSLYQPLGHTGNYDAWLYYANFYENSNTDGYDGPTNVGNYLCGDTTRTTAQTGASPYGVADLAGNVWEHLINCAWTTIPANGNGTTTPPNSWPTAASGKGLRGGSWSNDATDLRGSARGDAGWTGTYRDNGVGFRPARAP